MNTMKTIKSIDTNKFSKPWKPNSIKTESNINQTTNKYTVKIIQTLGSKNNTQNHQHSPNSTKIIKTVITSIQRKIYIAVLNSPQFSNPFRPSNAKSTCEHHQGHENYRSHWTHRDTFNRQNQEIFPNSKSNIQTREAMKQNHQNYEKNTTSRIIANQENIVSRTHTSKNLNKL